MNKIMLVTLIATFQYAGSSLAATGAFGTGLDAKARAAQNDAATVQKNIAARDAANKAAQDKAKADAARQAAATKAAQEKAKADAAKQATAKRK